MRTISAWWVAAMAETFKWQGLALHPLFAKANISLESLASAHNRYPQANVSVLWREAQALCPHLNIAIEVGKSVDVRALPVIGFALLQMESVSDAFELMLRYQKLMGGNTNARLIEHDDQMVEMRFNFANDLNAISIQSYEAAMAFCVKVARTVADKNWQPTKVCLSRPTPCEEAHRYFNCDIEYASDHHQLFFRNDTVLNTQSTLANFKVMQHNTITQVMALLMEQHLATGKVSSKGIAAQFGMSEKTLQRRLSAEGTTFRAELDGIRQKKSHMLLCDTQLSISEIAYLCGYSEISAFHHAFTRWYAMSPSQYRTQRGVDSAV
ncbi:AraC family transcriptional regulator [Pseudoalteromonas sp. GB56]